MFKMKLGNKSQVDPEEINVKFSDVKGVSYTLNLKKILDLKEVQTRLYSKIIFCRWKMPSQN